LSFNHIDIALLKSNQGVSQLDLTSFIEPRFFKLADPLKRTIGFEPIHLMQLTPSDLMKKYWGSFCQLIYGLLNYQ